MFIDSYLTSTKVFLEVKQEIGGAVVHVAGYKHTEPIWTQQKASLCEFEIKPSLAEQRVMKPYICVGLKMILCIGV